MTVMVTEPTPTQHTRHKPPPKVLVLRCDECSRRVVREGYLCVDRIAISDAKVIFWKILHSDCDFHAKVSDYRLRVELLSTTGDLLEATAFLLKNEPWIVETNWHGLISRVLADTREYADWVNSVRFEQENARRRELNRKRKEQQNGVLAEVTAFEEVDDDD